MPQNAPIRLRLMPADRTVEAPHGAPLQDLLFAQGVEFPCGGRGRCRGCRVRLLHGETPPTPDDRALLDPAALDAGWRLACRLRPTSDLTLELAQWEALILADDTPFEFTPREGLGIAVDLGTTTLVAQLVDLRTAQVLAVRTALNGQARHGADLMSRLDFACHGDGAGRSVLARLIRVQIGSLIEALLAAAPAAAATSGAGSPGSAVREVILVGNTAMHHLFGGLSVENLARHPFEPTDPGVLAFAPADLCWDAFLPARETRVLFLPCLGSFVGSDILAGILATRMHENPEPSALIDLGTNGEIVVGNRDRLICSSTAAGPAFEGARITMGMRAATGAISEVSVRDESLHCHVLGGGSPRGICGSGLVDAIAAGLDLGFLQPSGRLLGGAPLRLQTPIEISQCDVRELQLAKGAIAAGVRLLAARWGTTLPELRSVHLAGAFGNYINRTSARRIGLLPFALGQIRPAGNTALLGAKLALFRPPGDPADFAALRSRIEHHSLNDDPAFLDTYVADMGFPAYVN